MSKLRFLHISTYYTKYLNNFYSKNIASLSNISYEKHHQALMDDCFAWADFWQINLNKLGKYQADSIIFNDEILQKKWAKENDTSLDEKNWMYSVVEAQIEHIKPEVIFWDDAFTIAANYFKKLRSKFPFIKLLISWDGIACHDLNLFEGVDIILTPANFMAEYYNNRGKTAYHTSFGFETSILNKLPDNSNPIYDVTFSGSINKQAHSQRYALLEGLAKNKIPINIFSDVKLYNNIYSFDFFKKILKGSHKTYYQEYRLNKYLKEGVFGLKMYETLHNSKITLNTHIDVVGNTAANMRLAEATGVGSCLLTDWKENITDFFKPDEEIVTYKSLGEAQEKIKFLLENEEERKKIAKAGQKRALEEHNFFNKALDLDKIIQKHI